MRENAKARSELKLAIPEMDCASEEQQVRAALATLPEPVDARFV